MQKMAIFWEARAPLERSFSQGESVVLRAMRHGLGHIMLHSKA
jgi:hypothetical protein